MTHYPPEEETRLMERFVGLSVDEGRALYDTLSPAEQAVMGDRGLKRTWRSMRASETRDRPKREWRKMLDRRDKEEMAAWEELQEAEKTLRLFEQYEHNHPGGTSSVSKEVVEGRKEQLEGTLEEAKKKLAERREALNDGP